MTSRTLESDGDVPLAAVVLLAILLATVAAFVIAISVSNPTGPQLHHGVILEASCNGGWGGHSAFVADEGGRVVSYETTFRDCTLAETIIGMGATYTLSVDGTWAYDLTPDEVSISDGFT